MYQYYERKIGNSDFDMVLTEDSNSGFEMAQFSFSPKTTVISAFGNSNVLKKLTEYLNKYSGICIIADGAAFQN